MTFQQFNAKFDISSRLSLNVSATEQVDSNNIVVNLSVKEE